MQISGFTHSLLLTGNATGKSSTEPQSSLLKSSSTLSERRMLQESNDLSPLETCLELTGKLGLEDVFGVALGGDSFNTDLGCNPDMICDIELSPTYADSVFACSSAGGKVVKQEFTVCGQDQCLDQGCAAGKIPADYSLINVPMCFAQGCAEGTTDYLELGLTAYALLSVEMRETVEVPATFTQTCGVNPNILTSFEASETCFTQTFQLYENEEDPIFIAFGDDPNDVLNNPDICDSGNTTCDFTSTNLHNDATTACMTRGGKIVDQNFTACGEDFLGDDLYINNLPMCFATDCADNIDYIDMMVDILLMIAKLSDREAKLPASFLRECNPTPVDDSDSSDSSGTKEVIPASSNPTPSPSNDDSVSVGSPSSPSDPAGVGPTSSPPADNPTASDVVGLKRDGSAAGTKSMVVSFVIASTLVVGFTFSIF